MSNRLRVRRDSETSTDSWSLVEDDKSQSDAEFDSRPAFDDFTEDENSYHVQEPEDDELSDELSDVTQYSSDEEVDDEAAEDVDDVEEHVEEQVQDEVTVEEVEGSEDEDDDDKASIVSETDEDVSEGAAKYFVSPAAISRQMNELSDSKDEIAPPRPMNLIGILAMMLPFYVILGHPLYLDLLYGQPVPVLNPSQQSWVPEGGSSQRMYDGHLSDFLKVISPVISNEDYEAVGRDVLSVFLKVSPNKRYMSRRISDEKRRKAEKEARNYNCWMVGNSTVEVTSISEILVNKLSEGPIPPANVCSKRQNESFVPSKSIFRSDIPHHAMKAPKYQQRPQFEKKCLISTPKDVKVSRNPVFIRRPSKSIRPVYSNYSKSKALQKVYQPMTTRKVARNFRPKIAPCFDKNVSFAPCHHEKYWPSVVPKKQFDLRQYKTRSSKQFEMKQKKSKEIATKKKFDLVSSKKASESMRGKKVKKVEQCHANGPSSSRPCVQYKQPLPCRAPQYKPTELKQSKEKKDKSDWFTRRGTMRASLRRA